MLRLEKFEFLIYEANIVYLQYIVYDALAQIMVGCFRFSFFSFQS